MKRSIVFALSIICTAGIGPKATEGFVTSSIQNHHQQNPARFRDNPLHGATIANLPISSPVLVGKDETKEFDFPPPLSTVGRLKRASKFWWATAPIVQNYFGLIGKLKMLEIAGKIFSDDEIEKLWSTVHADGAQRIFEAISELKGFYVKAAQIVSSRPDLFPNEYTNLLRQFTDSLDPMPIHIVKAVIEQELLLPPGETFEDVFVEFDTVPLGAASVAQVHRAVLSKKYGGKEVAVKVQRPSIESKLMGDVANLKAMAKLFRHVESLPFDYYTVFSELEIQLSYEFDFVAESVAMERIYNSLAVSLDGKKKTTNVPVVIPQPIRGLVSQRVLVMDYLKGTPVSRMSETMNKKGINKDSLQVRLLGSKLIQDLTTVYGRNILETGFFHADPHPGNIFILENGDVGLIDFGQVKQISSRYRETLAKLVIALDENDGSDTDLKRIEYLTLELGIQVKDDANEFAAAAVAMWLFGGGSEDEDKLPGGYNANELSPKSPLKAIQSFPQDLVLVARSAMLIKALGRRFGATGVKSVSLANKWAPIARESLSLVPVIGNPRTLKLRSTLGKMKAWGKRRLVHAVARFRKA